MVRFLFIGSDDNDGQPWLNKQILLHSPLHTAPSISKQVALSDSLMANVQTTSWREVSARIHIALTPQQLANGPRQAASRLAFDSLLMRYSSSLGGVVVAHRGGLKIQGSAKFIGASPYPHLVATTNLLIFSPPRGASMVGLVTHVGPDHVAMSVHQAFNAVLPLRGLEDTYRFQSATWYCKNNKSNPDEHQNVQVGSQVRFLLSKIEPTRSRLFQIIASLDPALAEQSNSSVQNLGVIPPSQHISINSSLPSSCKYAGDLEEGGDQLVASPRLLSITKRNKSSVDSTADIFASNEFADSLMLRPQTERKPPVAKKRRRFSAGELEGAPPRPSKPSLIKNQVNVQKASKTPSHEITNAADEHVSSGGVLTQIELPDGLDEPHTEILSSGEKQTSSAQNKKSAEKEARRLERHRRKEKKKKEKQEHKEKKREKKKRRQSEPPKAANSLLGAVNGSGEPGNETRNRQHAIVAAALSAVSVGTLVEETAEKRKESLEGTGMEIKTEKSFVFSALDNDIEDVNGMEIEEGNASVVIDVDDGVQKKKKKKKSKKHSSGDSGSKHKKRKRNSIAVGENLGKAELIMDEELNGGNRTSVKKSKKRKRVKSEVNELRDDQVTPPKPSKKKKRESRVEEWGEKSGTV